LSLVLSLDTTENSLAPFYDSMILLTLTLKIFITIYKIPSQSSPHQAKQAQLPQPFLVGEMLPYPNHLCSPPLDSLQ